MDVLKPELQSLDGICYRINYTNITSSIGQPYEEEDGPTVHLDFVDDDIDDDYEIEEDKGRMKCSFHVAQVYFGYLNGTKGATKKQLEVETRTQITIPKPGRDGNIVVYGVTRKSVALAVTKIQSMVKGVKQIATQFVSLPLTSPAFRERFLAFKASVLENCKDTGIDETIFISENKLHLTVIPLVIFDDFEINEAGKVLRTCKETVIEPLLKNRPLKIEMSGLGYMKSNDLSKVNVLYSNATSLEDSNLLQTLVDGIAEAFKDSKTKTMSQSKNVKIHVTLMNTKYRQPLEETNKTFDARNVFKKYGDFSFGEGIVSRIDISVMGTSCPKTGYYIASSSIDLP